MAELILCSLLFVFLSVFAVQGETHITGLYCQDPDTGKLYPINSTWPSESFCGNYTCKLRQKNLTQTEYEPVTKINITAPESKNKTLSSDMDTSPSEQAFVVIKKVHSVKQPASQKETINKINAIKDEYKSGSTDIDRYLTEAEIKAITEILHTVKKSDLEAIVEIYNIAQEIYKEIDVDKDKKDLTSFTTTLKPDSNNLNNEIKNNEKGSVSYWYEPLHQASRKVKPADLDIEGSNRVPVTRKYTYPATYFKGPITEKDFKYLPYYYPVSNFQRASSYMHNYKAPPPPYLQQPRYGQPCSKKNTNNSPTWLPGGNKIKPEPRNTQIMQPMLLPYPYSYVHHYNFSVYPGSYYNSYFPWSHLNPYTNLQNYPQNYYDSNLANKVPHTAVLTHVESLEQNLEESNFNSKENINNMYEGDKEQLPDWQTEELSSDVIAEVKANILENSLIKPLNITKHIKLEKVGKVIKLDELARSRRDINSIDTELENSPNQPNNLLQYEPYIEKTTCESSTELGFFRMGNQTAPYPACCPQKIS